MAEPAAAGATFDDRYGKGKKGGKGRGRRFATEPHIDSPDVDFVMPAPDKTRVATQNYQVISVCAPEGTRVKCRNVAVKFSPCFQTLEEAEKHAKIIRDEDPRFDVDVIEMYNWISLPKSADVSAFVHKEYTSKFLTNVISGQQQAMAQSKKELDERVARDRAKAEAELRKKYGPDYVMKTKSDAVKQYEEEQTEREATAASMNFSQHDLMGGLAEFIVANKSIDPKIAGQFLQFMEAKKAVESATAAAPQPQGEKEEEPTK